MEDYKKIRISIISFTGIFLFSLGIVASERLLPELERILNLKHWQSGTIISANLVGFVISMLLGGLLSDFISRKFLIILGFLNLLIGVLIFGFTGSYYGLLTGNLLIGISGGLLEGLLSLIIMDIFYRKKGVALNFSQVFFGLGATVSPFLVMLFNDKKHFYLIIAIMCIITTAISLSTRFPDKHISRTERFRKNAPFSELFKNKRFIKTVTAMFLYSSSEMGITSWVSALFLREYLVSKVIGTLVLSLYWGAQLIGRATIGHFSDNMKPEKFISSLFFISAIFITGALLPVKATMSLLMFTLSGLSMATIWPTILSDARQRFNNFPGTAFGIIAATGASAGIIIPPLIGKIADIFNIRTGMYITVASSIAGGIIYLSMLLHSKNNQTNISG